jgi:hypothetical protein
MAGAATVLAILACVAVMRQRVLDHDEIEQAHTVWLMSLGDHPYTDFFEVHPPFGWMAMVPIVRGETDPANLALSLRVACGFGQVVTIVLLCANMRLGRRPIHPLWTAAAILTMLTSGRTIDYFAEFHLDAWANAALLGAILLARWERLNLSWRFAGFGLIAAASQLLSPKLPALVAIFASVELLRLARANWRDALRAAGAMFAGLAVALGLAFFVLRFTGIDPALAATLTIRYHVLLGQHGEWGFGLAEALFRLRMISGPAVAGLLIWMVAGVRRELRPNTFEVAVALFLFTELMLVPFPYKQYFTPWLLLAATFIPYWSLLTDRIRPLRILALPVAFLAILVTAAFTLDMARHTYGFDRRGAYWRLMAQHAGPNARVVVPVPDHPITTRDATYAWFGTTGPDQDYGPEVILRELRIPEISSRFTYPHYLRELENARPDVIVRGQEPDRAFPQKEAAISEYLRAHSTQYERRLMSGRVVFVRR